MFLQSSVVHSDLYASDLISTIFFFHQCSDVPERRKLVLTILTSMTVWSYISWRSVLSTSSLDTEFRRNFLLPFSQISVGIVINSAVFCVWNSKFSCFFKVVHVKSFQLLLHLVISHKISSMYNNNTSLLKLSPFS
jgi:hypothetical protein